MLQIEARVARDFGGSAQLAIGGIDGFRLADDYDWMWRETIRSAL
jgi:hypothetical protein